MKVLHVTPSFYPASGYGGPVYSGYALSNALVEHCDVDLRVLTTDSNGPQGDRFEVEALPTRMSAGYDVYYCRRRVGADMAPGMLSRLWPMIAWADVVHLTAVYSPPTLPTLLICKLLNKPVVWSLRGALQRWPGSTRTQFKKVWETASNLLCNQDRVLLHVTSEEEASSSLKRISNAKVALVPNGIDLPVLTGERRWTPDNLLRLLYLGRLHPIKGIENLILAVAKLDGKVSLAICGDGDAAYRGKLKSLIVEHALGDSVKLYGHVSEAEKQARFFKSDVAILPSFTENFGIVIAEALAAGVPVIASRATPWQRVEQIGCGLWVENTPDSLAEAIRQMAVLPLAEMGQRGREWMQKEFDWKTVARTMFSHYVNLLNPNPAADASVTPSSALSKS